MSDKAGLDVDLDDPDFWKKWAQKASVNLEDLKQVCIIAFQCVICLFKY